MSKRVLGSVAAAAAVVVLLPAGAYADQPSSGTASTATLTLTVSPNALLAVPSSALAPVSSQLSAALQPITLQIDSGHASATRSLSAADLSAGHADVTPISLNVQSLGTLLASLRSALIGLSGQVSVSSLSTALANVSAITGNNVVMALLPSQLATQLTTLDTQLATLTSELNALPSEVTTQVDDLQSTLAGQLGAQLGLLEGLTADLNSAHPNGQNSAQSALTVPPAVSLPAPIPTLPAVAQLAPFSAAAVNAAGAQAYGLSGPQASSNESTTNIAIGPSVDFSSLVTQLTNLQATLQQVSTTLAAVVPQLGAVSGIIAQALPGGLDLSSLVSQVSAALSPAGQLLGLVQGLHLNSLLGCNPQSEGSCALASTSVAPQGAGVHAMASSKLVDLSVLPMDATLASALSPLGATAGAPLLDIQGVQATADAVIDGATGSQTTSSTLAHIAVAGLTVVDSGQVAKSSLAGHTCAGLDPSSLPDGLPVGAPLNICVATPVGDLTVVITVGAPQYTYTGATHRSASLSKLEIRLLNGAPDGSNPVSALGATQAGNIATADVGAVSAEVVGAVAAAATTTTPPVGQQGNNVTMGNTGMFGPGSLLVGFGLLGAGGALRRVGRRGRRARGAAGERAAG